MTTKSNLHTHCTLCDGSNTIEEMVLAALNAGFESVGFSSHCHTGYPFDECGLRDPELYFTELERIKQKYQDRIRIFKGLELESRVLGEGRPVIDKRCDYTIGSLHLFRLDGQFFEVDYTKERWLEALKVAGSAKALVQNYLDELLSFARQSSFDIIGHFDLYTKFNEGNALFDEDDAKYQDMVLDYLDAFIETGKIFEVNTGAISRGYKKKPYPARFILSRLLEKKVPIILSSDAHSAKNIAHAFPETEKMLREMGFTEQMRLTDRGFVPVAL